MKLAATSLSVFTLLTSVSCVADETENIRPTRQLIELAETTDYLVTVVILDVTAGSEKRFSCPAVYTAKTKQVTIGPSLGSEFRFASTAWLERGESYLIFLEDMQSQPRGSETRTTKRRGEICDNEAVMLLPRLKTIDDELGTIGAFESRTLKEEVVLWRERFRADNTYLVAQNSAADLFVENFSILGLFAPQPDYPFLEPGNWLNWLMVSDSSNLFLGENALAVDEQQFLELVMAARH